ncbi:MAG: hypothetical protein PUA61_09875 [Succinatimonas hippei]|nr:hypothetical protein [Succinatimonas hippei]
MKYCTSLAVQRCSAMFQRCPCKAPFEPASGAGLEHTSSSAFSSSATFLFSDLAKDRPRKLRMLGRPFHASPVFATLAGAIIIYSGYDKRGGS